MYTAAKKCRTSILWMIDGATLYETARRSKEKISKKIFMKPPVPLRIEGENFAARSRPAHARIC